MLGVTVEFPVGFATWDIGTVVSYNEEIGQITVLTDEGEKFVGCESQVSILCSRITNETVSKPQ